MSWSYSIEFCTEEVSMLKTVKQAAFGAIFASLMLGHGVVGHTESGVGAAARTSSCCLVPGSAEGFVGKWWSSQALLIPEDVDV